MVLLADGLLALSDRGAGVPLRERLEAIADELMVDLDLADPVTT